MSEFNKSMVVICPKEWRSQILGAGHLLGVDGGLSVPLSGDGQEPATHYGAHAWVSSQFAEIMSGRALPDPMPPGLTDQSIADILEKVVVSVNSGDMIGRKHFVSAIESENLQEMLSDPAGTKEMAPETGEWAAGTSYAVNDQVSYQGVTYVCLQAHTAILGWEPPNVPALWAAV